MIYVHTLGTASIDVGSCTINPTSPRKFALLLYLAAERGRPIPRVTLQELIFPDHPERNARHSLRELFYQLRQMAVEIHAIGDGISLVADAVRVDHDELTEGKTVNSRLVRAASGGFLPGYSPPSSTAFGDWFEAYRARAISSISRALLTEVDWARNRGEWERTELAARACLALDPLNEEATVALAEMLFLGGGKAAATQLLDRYTDEVGLIHPDLKSSVRALQRRISQTSEITSTRFGTRFVGRAAEMHSLRDALCRALTPDVQCVVVSGEPGIGKSRLVADFARLIELEGVRCQSVTMQPHDTSRSMGAFVDLVPGLLRLRGALGCAPESMEALRRLTGVATAAPSQREQLELDAIAFGIADAVVDLCDSIGAEGPLAVIIEDAHSIDHFSLNVLSALLSGDRRAPILLLMTTREPRRLRRALGNEERVSWMPLRPLSTEAMQSLIDEIIMPGAPIEARTRLVGAANGNPLFGLALANQYRHSSDTDSGPATLVELLSRRLNPLSPAALSVLATCIALGKHSTNDRLIRAVGIAPITLLEALTELAEFGLLDVQSDHAVPSHPLIAEGVKDRLLPSMRSIVNLRVAEVFEEDARRLSSPAYWWDAGSRWRDAGNPERALFAFRECARHAMDIGRPADAARILNEALELRPSGTAALEAARELITAANFSSDTGLVLRGRSILVNAGIADRHDEVELAARRAMIRDSHLPERVVEMTLGCLRASEATPEHRVAAAILGLKSIHVAQSGAQIAELVETHLPAEDLDAVDEALRLEFELLLNAGKNDWESAAMFAARLMCAAEDKRPAQQLLIQQNCGIVLNVAGESHAAVDAWERAFRAAGTLQTPSHQVRLACLIAGVYADLFDDENWDAWITLAVDANHRARGFIDNFDLPVIRLCRALVLEDVDLVEKLSAEAQERGTFAGSPLRQRWGRAFALLREELIGNDLLDHEGSAWDLIKTPEQGFSGVRDFEIAAAATILGARDPQGALRHVGKYLSQERVSRQLLDRQLAITIHRLEAKLQSSESTHLSLGQPKPA